MGRRRKNLCDPASVPLTIGRMEADPKKIKEVYELGRDDARRQIEDMKVFLGIE